MSHFTRVDIGVNANLKLVDEFCYLGDMLCVDGDAEFELDGINSGSLFLTNKNVLLIVTVRLYSSCVRSSMLHGSET